MQRFAVLWLGTQTSGQLMASGVWCSLHCSIIRSASSREAAIGFSSSSGILNGANRSTHKAWSPVDGHRMIRSGLDFWTHFCQSSYSCDSDNESSSFARCILGGCSSHIPTTSQSGCSVAMRRLSPMCMCSNEIPATLNVAILSSSCVCCGKQLTLKTYEERFDLKLLRPSLVDGNESQHSLCL